MIHVTKCMICISLVAVGSSGHKASADGGCAVSQLLGVDGEWGGSFGYRVAASNDALIAGSYGFGSPFDGETSIFRFDGSQWVFEQKLLPSDDGFGFGNSLAIDGDVAVVGAPDFDAAYVFRRKGDLWTQEQKLVASDAARSGFGVVAIDDDWVLVGDRLHDHAGAEDSGAVYAFRFDGKQWIETQKIIPDNASEFDYFGEPIAISGDAAVVGVPMSNTNGSNAGSAYVLRRIDDFWSIEAELVGPSAGNSFYAWSVSIDGDVLVLGNRDLNTAVVYRYEDGAWSIEQTLSPSNGTSAFGESVAIRDAIIAVGANGVSDGLFLGSAFKFEYDGQTWTEVEVLLPPEGEEKEWFGTSVALAKGSVLVGAPGDSDNCWSGGAVYVFGPPGTDCNQNGVSDLCEIGEGLGVDVNNNGVPDDCEPTPGDINRDGLVGAFDLAQMLAAWGLCQPSPGPGCCPQDLTGDFFVDLADLAMLLANWQSFAAL